MMPNIKIFPTKKGNGLHIYIYHASPPGLHKLSLDFSTVLTLASQLWRESLKGLVAKDMETLEKWQLESIRDAFNVFMEINQNTIFEHYMLELLGSR